MSIGEGLAVRLGPLFVFLILDQSCYLRKKSSSTVSKIHTYKVYRGEKTKWLIEAIAEGFDTTCDYWLKAYSGGKQLPYDKVDLPAVGDRSFLVAIDTEVLDLGPVIIEVGVAIPDNEFPSGYREAYEKVGLMEVYSKVTRRFWDYSDPVVVESIHGGGLSIRATLLEVPAEDAGYEYLIEARENFLRDEDNNRLMCIR